MHQYITKYLILKTSFGKTQLLNIQMYYKINIFQISNCCVLQGETAKLQMSHPYFWKAWDFEVSDQMYPKMIYRLYLPDEYQQDLHS